jgi:hypothetical protein
MAEQYFLYTVTGLREPFYAAVDQETGRAWTAPTKDGAIRQASEAGIEGFIEQTITREKFLRSLGIEPSLAPKIHRDSGVPRHDPTPVRPGATPPGTWFIADEEAVDDDTNGKSLSIPPRLKASRKSAPPRGGSPFAGRPIDAPSNKIEAAEDDFLMIPSDHNIAAAPTPFTDAPPPPVLGDVDE